MNKQLIIAAAMAMAAQINVVRLRSSYQPEDVYKPVTRYRKSGLSPAQNLQERARLARMENK